MGIYLRYAAALIILATFSDSYAAVRKNVSMPTKSSVISNTERPFQTPNGSSAYFGQDHVDYHTAGNRFKPGDSPSASKQKITVKPVLHVNPRSAAKALVSKVRGGIPGAVASAVVAAAVAAVDGVIENSEVRFPHIEEVPFPDSGEPAPGTFYWKISGRPENHPSRTAACQFAASVQTLQLKAPFSTTGTTGGYCTSAYSTSYPTGGFAYASYVRLGTTCPSPSVYDSARGACITTGLGPATEADWQKLTDSIAASSSDFVRDVVRESCSGSLSPERCFDQMSQWGDMQGPAEQSSSPQTTTSTTTRPDGTTSTTTTTVNNKYNYTFGPTHYNYSTTTKVTTTTDGVTTETETVESLPVPGEEPDSEDESYSFDDSQMPEVPSFYEQKYPDGLSGVWDNASAQVNNSQFIQFLNGFVPSFSGSCPSFGLSFNIASWASYGSIGFSSLCYVFDFIKVILLVTALFTFRAITFGG